jgi:hypothetical protein
MLKPDPEMKKAAEFVYYEWDQFAWAAGVLRDTILIGRPPEDWAAGTAGRGETERALVEVALLHARALRDFFTRGRKDPGVHPTDILAVDFFDTTDPWTKPTMPYLQGEKARIDQALAHLSYDRSGFEVSGTDWDFKQIINEVEKAWREFTDVLPAKQQAWFDEAASSA